ncbi:hypothetical protein A4A49_25711 [Nicotiana attenuata]|uniref:RING-type domain-containing protein n=1 Tax=Nicotiana attenuata TaxID=49451 RepID=A0A1J6K8C3_NICAT|nr:hypothetical protein A4A49_25711 [Nicotiana attenuata]
MVGGPLGRKCKTNVSICSKVEEKQLEAPVPTSVSSVRRSPVLSSKKDTTQILKKNSSLAFSTKVLCGKETESTRELRSAETRNRSSFSAPTISSSGKTNTEKQNNHTVQVPQMKTRLKKGSESEAIKTSQVKDTPAPRKPPLPPVAKKIKKISAAAPQVLQEITPIQTSIHQSQPTPKHTKSSELQKTSSKTQLSCQKTQGETLVHQSKFQKAPTSDLSQKMTLNQNSVGKRRIPTSIRQSKSSTSTKEPLRIHEEPVYHIIWEGPDETFESSGITCPLCENDLLYMPDQYVDGYYDDVEPSVLPIVAILPCGHSFHSVCLDGIAPEENSGDPPCYFCLSCMS